MKKVLILLADGFEEIEALAPHDMMTRTHLIHVDLASTMGRNNVRTSLGNFIVANLLLEEADLDQYDAVMLPGGKEGTDNLGGNPLVLEAVKAFYGQQKVVSAICAAPSILGKLGLLDDKSYTCFPGFECGKGNYLEHEGAVKDSNIITGHSMYYSFAFAEEIILALVGKDGLVAIEKGTKGVR